MLVCREKIKLASDCLSNGLSVWFLGLILITSVNLQLTQTIGRAGPDLLVLGVTPHHQQKLVHIVYIAILSLAKNKKIQIIELACILESINLKIEQAMNAI